MRREAEQTTGVATWYLPDTNRWLHEYNSPYPDSDGMPMSDNTLQYEWMVTIKENLEALFHDRDDVFVAGDLLWYPVPQPKKPPRAAPDAMVVFGRPKGYRGSYRQWEEENIAPQVVFEILSPGNRRGEMVTKGLFYDRYGVLEYYIYDPDHLKFEAMIRSEETGHLKEVVPLPSLLTSPLLGVRFDTSDAKKGLVPYLPNGERFKTHTEIKTERDIVQAERDAAQSERDAERARADATQIQRDAERQRVEKLMAQLRAAGIEPEA